MPDARLTAGKGLGPVAAAALGGWAFLDPPLGAWLFAAGEIAFLAWVARLAREADAGALAARAGEPLAPDEQDLVRRYPLYFAQPGFARECSSVLAALGLLSLVLVPWLTYKVQWLQAIAIGACLFGVARLTKRLSPVHALRLAAAKGDRDALRLLSAHDGAARKLGLPVEGVQQPGADSERRG